MMNFFLDMQYFFIRSVQLQNNWIFRNNYFLEAFWMVVSGLSTVNEVSEVSAYVASESINCKVTKIKSFSDGAI